MRKISQTSSFCTACGVEAQTRPVQFDRVVGYIAGMSCRTLSGNMCLDCIRTTFRRTTLITFVFGWWGILSFFCTPITVISNLIVYLRCGGLRPVPPGTPRPALTEELADKLMESAELIDAKITRNCDIQKVAVELAEQTGVSPGEMILFIHLRYGEYLTQSYG